MLRHHLRTALRTLRRRPLYAGISLVGLSLGVACCLLAASYVAHETSYDDHWPTSDRLVRLVSTEHAPDGTRALAVAPLAWGPELAATRPEVKAVARMDPSTSWISYGDASVRRGEGKNVDDGTHMMGTTAQVRVANVDSTFFDVFGMQLLQGPSDEVLTRPYDVVLTKSYAEAHFPGQNPIGEPVKFADRVGGFEVVGVVEDVPERSHFQADAFVLHYPTFIDRLESWTDVYSHYTYLLLDREASRETLEAALPAFLQHNLPSSETDAFTASLQPVPSIHLTSDRAFEIQPGGDWQSVWFFGLVAGCVLVLACVNYANLAVAHATDRQGEIGVRRAMGARRSQLAGQLLTEAALVSAGAAGLAYGWAHLAHPLFVSMTGVESVLPALWSIRTLAVLIGAAFVGAVLAGAYPAFSLSRLDAKRGLEAQAFTATSSGLQKGLVVFQFATAVVLVATSAMIYRQVDYMQTKDLGYADERVMVVGNGDIGLNASLSKTKRELSRSASVQSVAAVGVLPGDEIRQRTFRRTDVAQGEAPVQSTLSMMFADTSFARTMKLEMVAGRWLRQANVERGDGINEMEVVLNETAVTRLGFETPRVALGTIIDRMRWDDDRQVRARGRVVGVVRDFHWSAMHDRVPPLAIVPPEIKWHLRHYVVRLAHGEVESGVAAVEDAWKRISALPESWSYAFVSETWDALYYSEQRLQKGVGFFAGLAVALACLGLFGLATFMTKRRRKEIGIRKALGATAASIVRLLSSEFLRLVATGCLVGVPVALWLVDRWLAGFAYRVDVGADVFAGAVVGTLALSALAVSYQSLSAARTTPASAIRDE